MSDLATIFGGGFDPNSVEPQKDYEVIPPGKYPVLIEKAEVKPTKSGTGHYIELEMSVLDGPHKSRKLWDRINIQNPSHEAQEIALRQLAALGQALGLSCIRDTAQLLNTACLAHVKVKNEQNEVRTYSPLTPAAAPGVPQVPATPQYAPPAPQYMPPPAAPQYPPPAVAQPQYTPPAPQQAPQGGAPGKPPWAR